MNILLTAYKINAKSVNSIAILWLIFMLYHLISKKRAEYRPFNWLQNLLFCRKWTTAEQKM
ncbi:hypothetical protein CHH60_14180 [Paenibacillus sp. 7523-1]|nr:hypothetical protein CHH60_14180 [Paenibacillus sp. 7523-1]